MSIQAWNEYRGWAKRARQLQSSASNWNKGALICVCLAALSGAVSAFLGEKNMMRGMLSLLAALFAATAAFVGKNILAEGDEPGWLQARATAEGIKSECYRYAARAGQYAKPDAIQLFQARRAALQKQSFDKPLPPSTMM